MNRQHTLCLLAVYALVSCTDSRTGDYTSDKEPFGGQKFREHIRSTEARTPEEQRVGFVLPEGFEIQLFASEPYIGKPVNLAFDARGRVWVTQSYEYPFAAKPGGGKDRITILEDTDGDGRADKFTNFSDTLNIPIGIFPVEGGAVGFSIPNVYHFTDSNGDGVADDIRTILGPFEYRDTHGMVNNFMRGYDGWIHACHGFTNRSTVAGADGDSITMISGNTFRFQPDGSRVEHITHGRINPFGLAFDELGYLYSTDCHTSPLYQLIRGGHYYQWGKEEEMGFAPDMKPLEKEATALAGLAYYSDALYPREYQGNFYIGDAVASRVYRNSFSFRKSTPVGRLEEEFVLSDDPWFRPVDVKLGPDGALYIADFYNSIIGHYEVPLDHPKRDKVRGRIWRITYKGLSNERLDLTTASVDNLISALNHDNLIVRFAAADQLVERIGTPAVASLIQLISREDASDRERVHALWVLHRLDVLTDQVIQRFATDASPLVRVHIMRILLDRDLDSSRHFSLVSRAIDDSDPHVKRAATELLAKFPGMHAVEKALGERNNVPRDDSHQLYTTRLVLRSLLRHEDVMKEVASKEWSDRDARNLMDVIVGVPSGNAARFSARYIEKSDWKEDRLVRQYEHLAQFIPTAELDALIAAARKRNSFDINYQYEALKGIQQGVARRGAPESPQLKDWGSATAINLLKKYPSNRQKDKDIQQRQKFAADLAGKYKVHEVEKELIAFLHHKEVNIDVKVSSLRALLALDLDRHAALAGRILKDPVSSQLQNRVAAMLGDFSGPAINNILADVTNASPDLQSAIVMALAATQEGKSIIFRKVKNGELLPRTLIQPKVEERLLHNISPAQEKEFREITAKLEPVSKERQTLIDTRLIAFNTLGDEVSVSKGREIFRQNCAVCHSIQGVGGAIGPQLDGVGKWGPGALAEKILDPNRNVSEAFRTYTIRTNDGRTLSGLFRREEGQVIVFADMGGKEFSVAKNEIDEQTASRFTLMPDHFGDVLSQDDFNALLKYLLSIQQ